MDAIDRIREAARNEATCIELNRQNKELRSENKRLKAEVAFFDNRCPRCNSTLGLLHESECQLCMLRAEVDRLIANESAATEEIMSMTDEELFENFDPEKCKSEYTKLEIEEWESWLALAHEIRKGGA